MMPWSEAYVIRAFDRYCKICPEAKLASYVDDNGVTRHGRWNDVKEGVCRAARALAECLQNDMQVVLSQENMTTFASGP